MLVNHRAIVSTPWAESGLKTVQCVCPFYIPSAKGRSCLIHSVNRPQGAGSCTLPDPSVAEGENLLRSAGGYPLDSRYTFFSPCLCRCCPKLVSKFALLQLTVYIKVFGVKAASETFEKDCGLREYFTEPSQICALHYGRG